MRKGTGMVVRTGIGKGMRILRAKNGNRICRELGCSGIGSFKRT